MKKKNYIIYILTFISLTVLAYFFPLTGKDLLWANLEPKNFLEVLKSEGCGLIPGLLLLGLTKIKLLRIIFIGAIGTLLPSLLKNTVNKNNRTLFYLGMFFILLFDKPIFSHVLANTTGFVIHFIGSLFLIIFIKLLINNSIARMNSFSIIILGLLVSSLMPMYSFIIFLSTLIYMLRIKEVDYRNKYLILIASETIGLLFSVFYSKFTYDSFSTTLIHSLIPSLRGSNFFSTLILSASLFFMAIKVFIKGKKVESILSILGISSYLFISLLSNNDILTYICFILFFIGSFYILYNARRNKLFKYKVLTIYTFKLLVVIFLSLFKEVEPGSMMFLYLSDILIILEIYNYIFPENFLRQVWLPVVIIIIGVNIYLYSNALNKYNKMNTFIKNSLECQTDSFNVPNRYFSEYIYKIIPENEHELQEYITYYRIDIYGDKKKVRCTFSK